MNGLFTVAVSFAILLAGCTTMALAQQPPRMSDEEINGALRALERRMHSAHMEAVALESKLVAQDKLAKEQADRIKFLQSRCGDPCKEPSKKGEESGPPTVSGTP